MSAQDEPRLYGWPIRTASGADRSFEEACFAHGINRDDVVVQFGPWCVTRMGIECLTLKWDLIIEKTRIGKDWPEHLRSKLWWTDELESSLSRALDFARLIWPAESGASRTKTA
jgi:hypothetical protein